MVLGSLEESRAWEVTGSFSKGSGLTAGNVDNLKSLLRAATARVVLDCSGIVSAYIEKKNGFKIS